MNFHRQNPDATLALPSIKRSRSLIRDVEWKIILSFINLIKDVQGKEIVSGRRKSKFTGSYTNEGFQPTPLIKALEQEGEATGEQRAQRRGLHHIVNDLVLPRTPPLRANKNNLDAFDDSKKKTGSDAMNWHKAFFKTVWGMFEVCVVKQSSSFTK